MGLSLLAGTASAENLAYVRASSQLSRAKSPAAYHPINLLDDDPKTTWCEGIDGMGEGEEIRIFFKKPQKIDRLVIGPATTTGRRVRLVKITDGTNTLRIPVDGQYVEQSFRPPMRGSKFAITIVEVGEANEGAALGGDVACLADIMLFYKQKAFGGRAAPSSLRYDKKRDRILGRWAGEPLGAPEKFITFALDGSWSWLYEPLMGGRKKRLSGEYRFRGNRLLMRKGETGRWADVRFKHRAIEVTPDDIGAPRGDYEVINLNAAIDDAMAAEYNNAEF